LSVRTEADFCIAVASKDNRWIGHFGLTDQSFTDYIPPIWVAHFHNARRG